MIVQTGYTIWSEREATLADTQRDVRNFSLILAEYTSRYIAVADLVLQELRSEFRRIEIEPEATLQNRLASPDIRDVLVGKVRNIPGDNALVLFTPDGTLVNYSRPGPAPVVNIADRDFITYFRKYDDPDLYISVPVQSRVTGAWTLFLARRVIASDGQFLGVIAAAIDLRYLHDFYRAILTNSSQAVTLLRRDGVVVARFPDPTNSIGTSMPPTSPWYSVVANAGGTYRSPGFFGASPSIVAAHPLHDYPLVIDDIISESEALKVWRTGAISKGSIAIIASLGFVLLFRVISSQFRRQLQHADQLIQATNAREYRASLLHAVATAATELLAADSLEEGIPKALTTSGKAVRAAAASATATAKRFANAGPATPAAMLSAARSMSRSACGERFCGLTRLRHTSPQAGP